MKRIPLLLALCMAGFVLAGADGCASDPNVEGAKLDLRNRDFDRALENVNTAIENNPENAEAWELKGQILQEQLQSVNDIDEHTALVDEMVEAYDTAIQYDPGLEEEINQRLRLAFYNEFQRGGQAFNRGAEDQAVYLEAAQYFANAARIQPDSSGAYVNQAFAYINAGQAEDAVGPFEVAIERGAADADVYYYLGDIYARNLEDPDQAIVVLQQGTEQFPDNADIRSALLNAYVQADRVDEALDQYRQAVDQNPDDKLFRYNYGSLLLQAERYDEAIEQLSAATAMDEAYADAWYNLGASYINKGVGLVDALSELDDQMREGDPTEQEVAQMEEQMETMDEERQEAFTNAIDPLQRAYNLAEAEGEDLTRICVALYSAYAQTNQLEKAQEVQECAGY